MGKHDVSLCPTQKGLGLTSLEPLKLTKGSDTLDNFLSKVAFESDFRKKACTCVMKTFAIFLFFRNKLSRLEHVLFLQVSFASYFRNPNVVSIGSAVWQCICTPEGVKVSKFSKSNMVDGRHLQNRKKIAISVTV